MNLPPCPLCLNPDISHYHADAFREYLLCSSCDLVFAHPDSLLSREEEFKRYQLHQNDLEDSGYRKFLHKLSEPMLKRIPSHSRGLDFGSGPAPLLKLLFEQQGHSMSLYDPFYAPEQSVWEDSYDFITSTEVVEHLYKPLAELDRLWACLKPRGYLGIMTSLRFPDLDFGSWYYIRDPTHVIFFAPQTMTWLAEHWGAQLEVIGTSVLIFQKVTAENQGESKQSKARA